MSDEGDFSLSWKRPDSVEYPRVWRTFQARDIDSDELVEYRIEDLPLSRAEEVFEHLRINYIPDEPIVQALGGCDDPVHFEDYKQVWKVMVEQKVALICFRAGSDEIVGTNLTFVANKDDHFMEKVYKQVKSEATINLLDVPFLVYENFNPFEYYNVNEYLASFGLSVDKKYRGRGIGSQFLATRKAICNKFRLKITHSVFSSDFSNQNADKAGFQLNIAKKYEDIMKDHPRFDSLASIKSRVIAAKSIVFD